VLAIVAASSRSSGRKGGSMAWEAGSVESSSLVLVN
jgi:hypothetical protein